VLSLSVMDKSKFGIMHVMVYAILRGGGLFKIGRALWTFTDVWGSVEGVLGGRNREGVESGVRRITSPNVIELSFALLVEFKRRHMTVVFRFVNLLNMTIFFLYKVNGVVFKRVETMAMHPSDRFMKIIKHLGNLFTVFALIPVYATSLSRLNR